MELLCQNKRYRRKLQRKGKTLCYEPEEDWTDDLLHNTPTPTNRDVAVQTIDVEDTQSPVQQEVSTDADVEQVPVVDRGTQVDIGLLELPLQQPSVGVDAPAQEHFIFWLERKQSLLNEMSVTQQAIDDLLGDLLQQVVHVSQPSNTGD